MGYFAEIYGMIETPKRNYLVPNTYAPHQQAMHEHNEKAVESLPDIDNTYPFLTRSMFGLARRTLHDSHTRGIIKQIIHFGASLKVDAEDASFADEWLQKFESLALSQIVWVNASVHFKHEVLGSRTAIYRITRESLNQVLYELAEVGERVEAKLTWESALGSFSKTSTI